MRSHRAAETRASSDPMQGPPPPGGRRAVADLPGRPLGPPGCRAKGDAAPRRPALPANRALGIADPTRRPCRYPSEKAAILKDVRRDDQSKASWTPALFGGVNRSVRSFVRSALRFSRRAVISKRRRIWKAYGPEPRMRLPHSAS